MCIVTLFKMEANSIGSLTDDSSYCDLDDAGEDEVKEFENKPICASFEETKAESNGFNREALLQFLQNRALTEPDWPETVPYEKIKRGQVYKAKEILPKELVFPKKYKHLAKEDEIDVEVDLEGDDSNDDLSQMGNMIRMFGLQQKFPKFSTQAKVIEKTVEELSEEIINPVDVDKTIQQVAMDDPSLSYLNFNNVKDISHKQFVLLFRSLKINTNLISLSLSNTNLCDETAKFLIRALEENRSIKIINLESNLLSKEFIFKIIQALTSNNNVKEFRACNQYKSTLLGASYESQIADCLKRNRSLLKLGLNFECCGPRDRVTQYILRNQDICRQMRTGYV